MTPEPPTAKPTHQDADPTRLQIELAQEKKAHAATKQQLASLQGLHRAQAATIASQYGVIADVIRRHPDEVQRIQTFGGEAEEERLRAVEVFGAGVGVSGAGMGGMGMGGMGMGRGEGRGWKPEIVQAEGSGSGRGKGRRQRGGG